MRTYHIKRLETVFDPDTNITHDYFETDTFLATKHELVGGGRLRLFRDDEPIAEFSPVVVSAWWFTDTEN